MNISWVSLIILQGSPKRIQQQKNILEEQRQKGSSAISFHSSDIQESYTMTKAVSLRMNL